MLFSTSLIEFDESEPSTNNRIRETVNPSFLEEVLFGAYRAGVHDYYN
jgi:hypothetical protein